MFIINMLMLFIINTTTSLMWAAAAQTLLLKREDNQTAGSEPVSQILNILMKRSDQNGSKKKATTLL